MDDTVCIAKMERDRRRGGHVRSTSMQKSKNKRALYDICVCVFLCEN